MAPIAADGARPRAPRSRRGRAPRPRSARDVRGLSRVRDAARRVAPWRTPGPATPGAAPDVPAAVPDREPTSVVRRRLSRSLRPGRPRTAAQATALLLTGVSR